MQIAVLFQYNNENEPSAASGIQGNVTDILLPVVGDVVRHSDGEVPVQGIVSQRVFDYSLPTGEDVDGRIVVTLLLARSTIH